MAYERDDLRDGLEDLNEEIDTYYNDPAYVEEYETFYERRDAADDLDDIEEDELAVDDTVAGGRAEEGFRETIDTADETNPLDEAKNDQPADETEAQTAKSDSDQNAFDERTDGRNL